MIQQFLHHNVKTVVYLLLFTFNNSIKLFNYYFRYSIIACLFPKKGVGPNSLSGILGKLLFLPSVHRIYEWDSQDRTKIDFHYQSTVKC